jgi:hypothetical protein
MTARKPRPAKPVYTRDVIRQNYLVHQRGGFISREDAWERLEHDMILAGREGRVLHPVPLAKICSTSLRDRGLAQVAVQELGLDREDMAA